MKRIIICVGPCRAALNLNMFDQMLVSLKSWSCIYNVLRYNFSSDKANALLFSVPLCTNNNTTPLAPLIKLNIPLESGPDVIIQCIIAEPISY